MIIIKRGLCYKLILMNGSIKLTKKHAIYFLSKIIEKKSYYLFYFYKVKNLTSHISSLSLCNFNK